MSRGSLRSPRGYGRTVGSSRCEPRTMRAAGARRGRAHLVLLPMPLYAATIFFSAFLLFLVQPITAKQILPWFGGSAAVWTTCLVFFQTTLLFGYAYSA